MVGWHHGLSGHEFEQIRGDGEGQGSLACCMGLQRVGHNLATRTTVVALQCCFISAVLQSESAVCIHISSPFWISFPFRLPQSTEWNSLCYTVGYLF